MSGLAAVVAFDADPSLPASHLDLLLAAAPHRGVDGHAAWHDQRAALGLSRHLLFDGAPSAPVSRDGRAMVFDGRLDNRDELIGALAGVSRTADDAQVAFAAFLEWGHGAVEHFEGIYAFVFWDGLERHVIAGRDPLGMRPLHWMRSGGALYFASDIAQLIAVCGVPPPDESAVADLLGGDPAADERTLFAGIHRLPPGSTILADARQVKASRHFSAEPEPRSNARSDADWAEECRALIDGAIRANLRVSGAAGVYLSGGVDSSTVLTAATLLCRRDGRPIPRALSLAYDHPDADESVFRRAAAARLACEPLIAQPQEISGPMFRAQAARYFTLPDLPSELSFRSIRWVARTAGVSVALTGVGPDMLFSGSVLRYADLLARGNVVGAVQRYLLDRGTEASGWTPGAMLRAGVWPLLSARLRTRLRGPARWISGVGSDRQWLRLPRADRGVVADPPPGVPHASWEISCSLRDGWTSYFLETAERAATDAAFEDRHPMMDARLVRFALSLPEDQRRRGRITKFVFRQAVPELAPEVAARTSKADFGHLLVSGLRDLGGEALFAGLAIAEAGWVDSTELSQRYNRATRTPVDDPQTGHDLPMLWMVAATELWFRAAYGIPEREHR